MPNLVLYQPDIAQNFGAILRLGACMGLPVHVIEPCGFPLDDRRVRRSGMDYIAGAELVRHASWEAYLEAHGSHRKILMTTKGAVPLYGFVFHADGLEDQGQCNVERERGTKRGQESESAMSSDSAVLSRAQKRERGTKMIIDDIIFGRESAGVPEEVHAAADHRILIPMPGQGRSLNLAMSAAMVAGELVRQAQSS